VIEATSRLSPQALRSLQRLLFATAALGLGLGVETTILHLTSDPLADVHAYYDAAVRLNLGQSLYPLGADPNLPGFYRYPPLLAILLRPFASLPFGVFAAGWELLIVAAFGATMYRLGLNRRTLILASILALPIAWSVIIGQAQVLVTLLLAVGAPWSVALAGQLKLFPALVGLYWLARGEWRSFGAFVAWTLMFLLAQVVLAPASLLAFVRISNLGEVGNVRNISPYQVSPILWVVVVILGVVTVVRLAPTRWGWAAAVALSVFATPRLLVYMLGTLLAAVRPVDPSRNASAVPPVGE
jgi:hypothetical protein